MQRYAGEDLRESPHIVVMGSCKVGNLIVSIPTLEGVRKRFPSSAIGFIGSSITADLESALPCIDWRLSWDEEGPSALRNLAENITQKRSLFGNIDLVINLDGFNPVTQVLSSLLAPVYIAGNSLGPNRRAFVEWGEHPQQRFLSDADWDTPGFALRYADTFKSNYIAELFAGLAWVKNYCDPTHISLPSEAPPFDVPDVLIHCTTARSAKVWPFPYWKILVEYLQAQSVSVGLIGSPPKQQKEAYNGGDGEENLLATTAIIDLRGKTSLLQLVGACAEAKAVITVDAGPLHIAAAVGTPTYAIVGNDAAGVGASPIRLWMPRSSNVTRSTATVTCALCEQARFGNDGCLAQDHACMSSVTPDQVIAWIQKTII